MPLRYWAEVNTDDFIPDHTESPEAIFQGKSTQKLTKYTRKQCSGNEDPRISRNRFARFQILELSDTD